MERPSAAPNPPSSPLPELPVRPEAGRAAVDALAQLAARVGVAGRVRGFVLPPRATKIHLSHVAVLGVAWALSSVASVPAALLACVVLVSALGRRWGIGALLPAPTGGLGWNLVLAPRTPHTRVVLAGALDLAARPRGETELVAAAALLVALGALGLLSPWLVIAAVALVGTWVLLGRWRRPFVDLAAMVRTAIDCAALGRSDLAVVVASGGAETGAGAWAFLDWWDLGPQTRVLWMGDVAGADALRRLGYPVDVVAPHLSAVTAALEGRP